MVFSDTTKKDGIIQTIEDLLDFDDGYISGSTPLLRKFTAKINRASHAVNHIAFFVCGNWQYDDGNFTSLPQSTTNLISGTRRYGLPESVHSIQRVEAMDANGLWYQLKPITKEMISDGLDEFFKTDGQPSFYRLINNTLELLPAANYAKDGGLKIFYDRTSVDFVYNATTATPGFSPAYHYIIPLKVAIDYLKIKLPDSPSLIHYLRDEAVLEAKLTKHFASRFKALKPKITRKNESWK